MLRDFAWSYFEKTGSIEAYLTYRYLNEAVIEENEWKPSGKEPTVNPTVEPTVKPTVKPTDKPTGTDN